MRAIRFVMTVVTVTFAAVLMATPASAQIVAEGGGVIIKGASGGPYTISRDGGRTWQPYAIKPQPKPVKLEPVPKAPNQACDFYQCGSKIIVVPTNTQAPLTGVKVGSGTINGNRVDPKTNVLR